MEEKYVALAMPVFFVLIMVELLVSRRAADPRYRFADSITNLSCGAGQQLLEPFFRTAALASYIWLYEMVRFATVPVTSVFGWVALVVGVDFFYYVFHRASHRINLFWATHVVHHQSEDYNLAVALRQSWLELLFSWVFYLPLALVGFSPAAFLAVSTLNTLYQFWIHTREVGKLPRWIEAWLNTPSHHRVHHGVNPKYIDKNYAGMFIVWDRLFGTFQEEEEEPAYGTVHPLASFNPLWANVAYWGEMAAMARATGRLVDKVRVLWAPPEWRPLDLSNGIGRVFIPEVDRATRVKYDVRPAPGVSAYVVAEFVLLAVTLFLTLWFAESTPRALAFVVVALGVVELVSWGALFERRWWGLPVALARHALAVVAAAWFAQGTAHGPAVVLGASLVALAAAGWLVKHPARAAEEGVRAIATV